MLDIQKIRADFPILKEKIRGKQLVYLDNGASTQKPQIVIDTEKFYYEHQYANIHRGVHFLSQLGTDLYEQVRQQVQAFIHAKHDHEIIYTKGTTNAINLIAYSFGKKFIQEGDEIVVTEMEHHSNIVPWQILCEEKKCILKYIPLQPDGTISIEDAKKIITTKTKLVSFTYVSNALGTVNPIQELIAIAHQNGAKVLIDAAQAIQHFKIDVQALNVDFLVFSGHKIYGPTGTGILYGKESILNEMPPYEGGGDMIKNVSFKGTEFNDLPFKFEAGTPNIAGCIALGKAIEYVQQIGLDNIYTYETELLTDASKKLEQIEGLKIYGNAKNKSSVISFLLEGIHPYDVGIILDNQGIAIRTGHHCAQPVMDYFGIPGTCRATFSFYNTKEEIDLLVDGILKAQKMLA
ncbi:MAG TPA: cysteine desulfurase [Chitinophagales bacterium]|jgi:cysteine desulfurase/selenocysteine lyase|nr:cysteine desulfurase [Chitinophagales bacterium]HQV77373.1 cysteine desulfurase [Chitinophagales bacterium]HQW78435.1 cysteine desulfurase [Chitinophagales bacterium]HRB19057.1 cysteine desulfurase [Chitinophagales bacterium]HRB67206.1 cysteine desulfurase [Chitinophagales bacterium]